MQTDEIFGETKSPMLNKNVVLKLNILTTNYTIKMYYIMQSIRFYFHLK